MQNVIHIYVYRSISKYISTYICIYAIRHIKYYIHIYNNNNIYIYTCAICKCVYTLFMVCIYIYIYMMHNALCEYKGVEGNVLLPYITVILLLFQYIDHCILPVYCILVAPPAAHPLNSTRLNLHLHRRNYGLYINHEPSIRLIII